MLIFDYIPISKSQHLYCICWSRA